MTGVSAIQYYSLAIYEKIGIAGDDALKYQAISSCINAVNQLEAAGMKGTFFLNGKNFGELKNYVPLLKRMRANRHQIGSH
ncbi:hypothetical protein BN1708_018251, partial [Verticillium longisporum]